jgi:hypothetical protein
MNQYVLKFKYVISIVSVATLSRQQNSINENKLELLSSSELVSS